MLWSRLGIIYNFGILFLLFSSILAYNSLYPKKEYLRLASKEFIRRFALHILPKGFVRIRHYGFLSNTGKRLYLKKVQDQLGKVKLKTKPELKHLACPKCKQGNLFAVAVFDARGPPKHWLDKIKNIMLKKLNAKT